MPCQKGSTRPKRFKKTKYKKIYQRILTSKTNIKQKKKTLETGHVLFYCEIMQLREARLGRWFS